MFLTVRLAFSLPCYSFPSFFVGGTCEVMSTTLFEMPGESVEQDLTTNIIPCFFISLCEDGSFMHFSGYRGQWCICISGEVILMKFNVRRSKN